MVPGNKIFLDHARFWISSEGNSADKVPISGGSIRKILTITDPDNHIAQAVNAGAMVVSRWAKGMAGDWAGRQIRLAITARLAAHSVNNRKATRLILY